MNLWEQTRRAHQDIAKIIGSLTAGDWDRPTPCSEWTVRGVVAHLIDNNDRFAALATGRPQRRSGSFEESSADFLGAFGEGAQAKSLDFGRFGVLPGREHRWDDELAAVALRFASRYPDVAPVCGPGVAFAHAVDAPPDAGPGERLVALLGRSIRA